MVKLDYEELRCRNISICVKINIGERCRLRPDNPETPEPAAFFPSQAEHLLTCCSGSIFRRARSIKIGVNQRPDIWQTSHTYHSRSSATVLLLSPQQLTEENRSADW